MKRNTIIFACAMLTVVSITRGAESLPIIPAQTTKTRILLRPTGINACAFGGVQAGKITSPTVAARRLYNAWKNRNRKAALRVASPEAVTKLFSIRWRPMRLKACDNENGSFECIYRDAKLDLDLAMVIEGGASAGYHVETVSFSTEAAFLPLDNPFNAVRMDERLPFKN